MDFKEAREIIEAAKKRGMIRAADEPAAPAKPEQKPKEGTEAVLPDWLMGDTSRDSRRW